MWITWLTYLKTSFVMPKIANIEIHKPRLCVCPQPANKCLLWRHKLYKFCTKQCVMISVHNFMSVYCRFASLAARQSMYFCAVNRLLHKNINYLRLCPLALGGQRLEQSTKGLREGSRIRILTIIFCVLARDYIRRRDSNKAKMGAVFCLQDLFCCLVP